MHSRKWYKFYRFTALLVKGTEDIKLFWCCLGKIHLEFGKVVRKGSPMHAQSCNIVVPYHVAFNSCCRLCYVEIYG
jgi:hypothetical protein